MDMGEKMIENVDVEKTWRKLVPVTWVAGLDTNFLGVFLDESAAECEHAAHSGL